MEDIIAALILLIFILGLTAYNSSRFKKLANDSSNSSEIIISPSEFIHRDKNYKANCDKLDDLIKYVEISIEIEFGTYITFINRLGDQTKEKGYTYRELSYVEEFYIELHELDRDKFTIDKVLHMNQFKNMFLDYCECTEQS